MEKRGQLRQTSRVNDKIMEYWKLFGQDRDLDKFMRLDSPASSQHSVDAHSGRHCSCAPTPRTTNASCNSCCANILSGDSGEGTALRQLFDEEQRESTDAAVKPADSKQIKQKTKSRLRRAMSCTATMKTHGVQEIVVPIQLETPVNENYHCMSADDVRTPQKTHMTTTKQTQTPESVIKSHKRLEWDSLGDVGYKKSSSTSNISTLERSVLKEIFQDGTMPEQNKTTKTNASESDLKRLQNEYATPPLASSTFVDPPFRGGARPKSTQTSVSRLPKLHDQSAQTSSRKTMETRSVQATPSLFGSSATPSSFEYFSSRSSTATSTNTGTNRTRTRTKKDPHAYIAHINEIISRRHVLVEKNQRSDDGGGHKRRESFEATLLKAANLLTEDKENVKTQSSTTPLTSATTTENTTMMGTCAPELDLGIQLLCSLVDAKSLNHSQKKRLIRDIAKRISCLDSINNINTTATTTTTTNSSNPSGSRRRTQRTSAMTSSKKVVIEQNTLSSAEATKPTSDSLKEKTQEVNSTTAYNARSTSKAVSSEQSSETSKDANDAFEPVSIEDATTKFSSYGNSATTNIPVSSISSNHLTTTTTASSSNTSSNSSKDASTQKINVPVMKKAPHDDIAVVDSAKATHTDLEQATMREWLNPMTQSEIEYEEKRRSVAKILPKASRKLRGQQQQQQQQRQMTSTQNNENLDKDGECILQLNWIETEIQRLESLRLLLNKVVVQADDETITDNSAIDELPVGAPKKPTPTLDEERVYDSVDSGRDVEIYVDKTNQNANSMPRKKPNKPSSTSLLAAQPTTPVKAETKQREKKKELKSQVAQSTVQIHIERDEKTYNERMRHVALTKQLPPTPTPPPPPPPPPLPSIPAQLSRSQHKQRAKLATPQISGRSTVTSNTQRDKLPTPTSSCATSGGGAGSESVCSFVQQRKREFIEHYNNKKRQQLELLLQQQQQEQTEIEQRRQKQLQQQQQQRKCQSKAQHQLQCGALYQHQQQLCNCHHHHAHYYHVANANSCQKLSCACANAIGSTGLEAPVYYQVVPIIQAPHKNYQTADAGDGGYCRAAATAAKRVETVNTGRSTVSSNAIAAAGINSAPAELDEHNRHNTISTSSSLFCMSSEISIPMGTSNSIGGTTTTTTTTHQYDDVAGVCAGTIAAATAAGGITKSVGIQTGSSMRRTCPINVATKGRNREAEEFKSIAVPTTTKQTVTTTTTAASTTTTQLTTVQTKSACVQVRPRGIAYVIEFTDVPRQETRINAEQQFEATSSVATVGPTLSLQDHLQRSRPKFCAQSKERKSILNHMQMLRAERRKELENIVENASNSSLDRRLAELPPAPSSRLRIFSTREMKALTNKRCKVLPEVLERQRRESEDRRRRGNRLIRDVFNRRLQRRVRSGKISLNHSRTII